MSGRAAEREERSRSSTVDAELNVRLELLRCRQGLDAISRELGIEDVSASSHAASGVLRAVEAAVADSRELKKVKSSLRYRWASAIARVTQKPVRTAACVVRGAKRVARRLRDVGFRAPNVQQQAPSPAIGGVATRGSFVPATAADSPETVAELTIAAVLDPFSASSFAAECKLIMLDPVEWPDQLKEARPHVLVVESAWTGMSGEWSGRVERAAEPLRVLVSAFRSAGIPTVFWNKEDPLHFGAFLETAALFDYVLTTDADCIPRYRRLLGHDRVGVMPFAVQPTIHHPVSSEIRRRSSVFAGAWYGRLPDRVRDFTSAADSLALAGELVIHDRLSGGGEPYQRFPSRYRPMIRPAVPYSKTGEIFRRHWIGLNLNTIKSSPTMFARRALELAACGTSVYGNHSVGLQLFLGDSIVATDDPARLLSLAWAEFADPHARTLRMRRLRALRAVMKGHTWANRVQQIGRMALGLELARSRAQVVVVARVKTHGEVHRIYTAFERQVLPNVELIIDAPAHVDVPGSVKRLEVSIVPDTAWVALFHVDDYYGAHYLLDLAHATMWGQGDVIGKATWHRLSHGGISEINAGDEYKLVDSLALRRLMFRRQSVSASLDKLLDQIESGSISGVPCVSIDAWEYVEGGGQSDLAPSIQVACAPVVSDVDIVRAGRLQPAQPNPESSVRVLNGAELAALLEGGDGESISVTPRPGRMELCSILNPFQKATLSSRLISRDALETSGRLRLFLQGMSSTATNFRLDVVGARGRVLESVALAPQTPVDERPPADTRFYRLTVDVIGPVVQEIDGIWIGTVPKQPLFAPGRGRVAVVSNGYPRYGARYRNAFVHRRVLAYQERGIGVDVFVVRAGAGPGNYEYEGVLVRECSPQVLAATLATSGHAAVAVHFMDADIWDAVRVVDVQTPLVVWIHGAEVQSWRHRQMNYSDAEELELAKSLSSKRVAFWRRLLTLTGRNLKFVFVSRYLAEQTWSDLGVRSQDATWLVIHNPIDSDLFRYRRKPPRLAKRILSIRPHASRIYANDLVAATIHRLATERVFSELQFTLVGDGPLWEQNFAGLERYSNVSLIRGFLSQSEIASLHQDHGVFLVPTRGDTHGVSRDEAMSSGLVPITTAAGAIPEFVDPSCGELCQLDDAEALAAAVLRLVSDPARFSSMSARAARRVERQSGVHQVIIKELQVLGFTVGTGMKCCVTNAPDTRGDTIQ